MAERRRRASLHWHAARLIAAAGLLAGDISTQAQVAGTQDLAAAAALVVERHVGPTVYRGEPVAERGVVAFRGIPFARPPVGERRWLRPEPVPPIDGVVDATRFAPACMQSGSGLAWYHGLMRRIGVAPSRFPAPEYSEDCLYLNIWSGSDGGPLRPVIVYVHGGSNTGGWSYEPNYRGTALAARGAIVVTVAYRLGVFGFLTHPDLPDRNFALHDLAMALAWVRQHIAAFGGDPQRITLMGESAGAANASHLMVSPLSRTLAQRLIHQSGGWQFDGLADLAEAEALGRRLETELVGEDGGLDAIRRLSAQAVLDAAASVYADFYFSPVPDGVTLPASLGELARRGELPAFDLLLGSNGDESLMYLADGESVDDWLIANHARSRAEAIREHLGAASTEREQLNVLRTAAQFACPSARFATAVAEAGGRSFVYEFTRQRVGLDSLGAYHGAELPYVFDSHDDWLPTQERDRELTRQMVSRWLSFAASGEPVGADGAAWPEWHSGSRRILSFGDELSVRESSYTRLCEALGSTPRR
ncbi:MAG: carboxylesterase family protein [Halieaceae bacterium]|jgi:para-nitrobenzyl esterase|nr:carboxylesterase family protein [Halieaceae bacterium]